MTRTLTIAVLTLACIAVECSAAPPQGKQGKGPQAGRQGAQQRGGDPAQIVARMMKEFDTDGDQKLDLRELTALMTSMRERREQGTGGPRAGGQRPGQLGVKGAGPGKGAGGMRQRPGAGGKQTQAAGENHSPGGEKPKRPEAE